MAYQAKHRDPLFDSAMQAAIERRGRELLGLVFLCLGAATAALLWSYSPDDPSVFATGEGPTENWLGTTGASIAAPLMIVVGNGAWVLAAVAVAWGLRLMTHVGTERALGRLIFAPIALGIGSVYAATLTPGPDWSHTFGLGGLFGDTVLGALLNILPVPPGTGVRLMAVPVGLAALWLALFAMGVTVREIGRGVRLVAVGLVLAYDGILRLLGGAVSGGAGLARGMAHRARSAREARADAGTADEVWVGPEPIRRRSAVVRPDTRAGEDADEEFAAPPLPVPAEPRVTGPARRGLLASVTTLVRRPPEPAPELVEPAERRTPAVDPGTPSEDRIRARIADAIRMRSRMGLDVAPAPLPGEPGAGDDVSALADGLGRAEPPLRRRRRPEPLILKVPGAVPTAPMAEIDPLPRPAPEPLGGAAEMPAGLDALPSEDLPSQQPRKLDRRAVRVGGELGLAQGMDDDDDALIGPDTDEDEDFSVAVTPSMPPRPAAPQARAVVQHPTRRTAPSKQARAEAQPSLTFEEPESTYETPPLSLLTSPESVERHVLSDEALEENARMLENVLDDYGVKGEIVSVRPGPVVTMYELEPAPGLKASRVIGLADDIARSMSALSARVSTVPGRSVIGIELPNANREKVVLREILSAREYGDTNARLPLALGKDIGGGPMVANLAKMPHLLIAGTTGSGKSVAINTMILSLLYRLTPEECRLIMIDPKMLELSVYDGIPHLLSPVVTDPKKAVVALKWVVAEMEERYRKMSKMNVRNIEGYNGKVRHALAKGEMFKRTVQTGFDDETGEPLFETEEFAPELLPFIVVIVDEMADLMMVAGKEIEACIQRLAQMARASGIHLIMATQRPSVDVITGTIKANFPTRISFQVTSKVDSRTILGEMGAEQLLGMGDMLYMAGGAKITRCHGPFVSDEEVEEVVRHLKSYGPPDYVSTVVEGPDEETSSDIDLVLGLGGNTDGDDALYDQAVAIVARDRKCSTSYIQRKLAIGYNKAARLVEQMEDNGVVGPSNSVGKREILVPEPQG